MRTLRPIPVQQHFGRLSNGFDTKAEWRRTARLESERETERVEREREREICGFC
jgi:hypothetical protein